MSSSACCERLGRLALRLPLDAAIESVGRRRLQHVPGQQPHGDKPEHQGPRLRRNPCGRRPIRQARRQARRAEPERSGRRPRRRSGGRSRGSPPAHFRARRDSSWAGQPCPAEARPARRDGPGLASRQWSWPMGRPAADQRPPANRAGAGSTVTCVASPGGDTVNDSSIVSRRRSSTIAVAKRRSGSFSKRR